MHLEDWRKGQKGVAFCWASRSTRGGCAVRNGSGTRLAGSTNRIGVGVKRVGG